MWLYIMDYPIISTSVVRSSYILEEEQQLDLTNLIFEQLSTLEE